MHWLAGDNRKWQVMIVETQTDEEFIIAMFVVWINVYESSEKWDKAWHQGK